MLVVLGSPSSCATTIAFDGKALAADSQSSAITGFKVTGRKKIVKINECLIGSAGYVSDIKKFQEWFTDPCQRKPRLESFSAIVVMPGGDAYEYDESCIGNEIKAPFAIGSGAKAALAAMKAGAGARRAVEIASEVDIYTGGEIVEFPVTIRPIPQAPCTPGP